MGEGGFLEFVFGRHAVRIFSDFKTYSVIKYIRQHDYGHSYGHFVTSGCQSSMTSRSLKQLKLMEYTYS